MPADAPAAKRAATEGYGARVVAYDRATENREEVARAAAGRGRRRSSSRPSTIPT